MSEVKTIEGYANAKIGVTTHEKLFVLIRTRFNDNYFSPEKAEELGRAIIKAAAEIRARQNQNEA